MQLATVALFVLIATLVNLKPVVDENFFFSSSDPQFKQTQKIWKNFPAPSELILAISSRDISSAHYLVRIKVLTQRLKAIRSVTSVKSLTDGPKNFQDALASPFWSRLLVARDRKASNVIVFFQGEDTSRLITRVEKITHEMDGPDFRIHIS